MDIKMKTEDVQEAIREYYIRRGYTRDRLIDIHIKGGRKVKGNDIPNNGTVELTLTDAYIRPIEDDIIPPPTFNAAEEDVSSFVSELEDIMDDNIKVVLANVPKLATNTDLSQEKQLEMMFDGVVGVPKVADVPKVVTAGSKFKSLFS